MSFPGVYGIVTRPNHVRVRAQDRNGEVFEAEGEALLARAFERTGSRDMALAYEDFKQEFLDSWGAAFSERVHAYTEYAFYPALVDFTLASV